MLEFHWNFCKFVGLLVDGSFFCISLLSSNNSLIFPSLHNFNCLSNAIRWLRAFDLLLGFSRSKAGITYIALSAILFRSFIRPLIKKASNFINKLLNRGASRYHNIIFTPVNYLFISFFLIFLIHCISMKLFVLSILLS